MALITGNTSLDPTNETLAMISPITTAYPTTDQDSRTSSRQAPRRTTVSRTARDERIQTKSARFGKRSERTTRASKKPHRRHGDSCSINGERSRGGAADQEMEMGNRSGGEGERERKGMIGLREEEKGIDN